MKNAIDLIQIAIKNPIGATITALLLVLLFRFGFTLISDLLKYAGVFGHRYIIKPTKKNGFVICLLSLLLFFFSGTISDELQLLEQTKMFPIYAFEYTPDESKAVAIFETEIQKKVSPSDFEYLKQSVKFVADSLGCTPLVVYQVALSECRLNPFTIRADEVAAGWMQLTNNGCAGLVLNGEAVTMPKVRAACRAKNIRYIMDACTLYLLDRANGKKVSNLKDFYLLVFAPAFVGSSDSVVLYEGFNNASYYLNSGLDGYFVDGAGRIVRLNRAKDGKITVGELHLHVKRAYIDFVKRY